MLLGNYSTEPPTFKWTIKPSRLSNTPLTHNNAQNGIWMIYMA